jgi:hypothetical protein
MIGLRKAEPGEVKTTAMKICGNPASTMIRRP